MLTSIKEFPLKRGFTIGIFQGNRGANPKLDIRIMYRQANTRVRTPQHLHWAVDLLIKKEHKPKLTLEFAQYLCDMWAKIKPFTSVSQRENYRLSFSTEKQLRKFESLNAYGDYPVEFTAAVIELLMIQEKTGHARAFMFKGLLDAIHDEKDIFSIISSASYGGR